MEKNQTPATSKEDAAENEKFHANNAYSGSGTMQPGGGTGTAGNIADDANSNLADADALIEGIQDEDADLKADDQPTGETVPFD